MKAKGYLKRIVEVNNKFYKFVGKDYTLSGGFGTCLVKWFRLRGKDPELIDNYITVENCENNHKKLVYIINYICGDLDPIFE